MLQPMHKRIFALAGLVVGLWLGARYLLPILLPFFWGVRLVNSVFNTEKRRKLKIELTQIAQNNKNTKK